MDVKYSLADIDHIVDTIKYLDIKQKNILHKLLIKCKVFFDGTLGQWTRKTYTIHLKYGVTSYHGFTYKVSYAYKLIL